MVLISSYELRCRVVGYLYHKISVWHNVRKTWTNGRHSSWSSLDLMLPFLVEADGPVDSTRPATQVQVLTLPINCFH